MILQYIIENVRFGGVVAWPLNAKSDSIVHIVPDYLLRFSIKILINMNSDSISLSFNCANK